MKKKIILTILLAACIGIIFKARYRPLIHPYAQEYLPGTGNIQGNVNVDRWLAYGPSFSIGADADGYAVFKDPDAALKLAKEVFKDGIDLLKQTKNLPELTKYTYTKYYIDTTGESYGTGEKGKQIQELQGFLDIYENSYSKFYSRELK